jgi:hypothetical protein
MGAPTLLVRRNKGGRSRAPAIERPTSAASNNSAPQVPNVLTANIKATAIPAIGPRIGEIASANGALLLAASALGKTINTETVVSR